MWTKNNNKIITYNCNFGVGCSLLLLKIEVFFIKKNVSTISTRPLSIHYAKYKTLLYEIRMWSRSDHPRVVSGPWAAGYGRYRVVITLYHVYIFPCIISTCTCKFLWLLYIINWLLLLASWYDRNYLIRFKSSGTGILREKVSRVLMSKQECVAATNS